MYPSLFLVLLALAAQASPVPAHIKRQEVLTPEQVAAAEGGAGAGAGEAAAPADQAAAAAAAPAEGGAPPPTGAEGAVSTESAVVAGGAPPAETPAGEAVPAEGGEAPAATPLTEGEAGAEAPPAAEGEATAPPAEGEGEAAAPALAEGGAEAEGEAAAPPAGGGEAAPAPAEGASADLTVVKFAALAESLEAKFYEAALQKFSAQSFTDAGFADGQAIFDQISIVQKDEQTHLTTLQSVATTLGGSTADLDACTFNFDAALTDVTTFLATARVLEFVGVDAYIGGTTLIVDKALLVSAAQITTVEGRHNTVLNLLNGGSSVPNAFDMVLSPEQVLSVAAPFISGGCDPSAALGLTPMPALTVTNTEAVLPGTLVTFGGAGLEGQDTATLFCNMIVGGATEAIVLPVAECVVPDGLDGPVHLFVTNSETPLSSNIVNQDASIIVAGPAVAFIDTIPNAQTVLIKGQGQGAAQAAVQAGEGAIAGAGTLAAEGEVAGEIQPLSAGESAPVAVEGGHEDGGGKKVVITKVTVTRIRHGLGISKPVEGGHDGAVALGWY